MPDLTTLGKRLRYVRHNLLRLSTRKAQKELKRAGVDVESHSTVLRYEADKRNPGADYVLFFVQRAGVSAHWLLTGEGDMKPARQSVAERAFQTIAAIVDDARATSSEIDAGVHPAADAAARAAAAAEKEKRRRQSKRRGTG